jgi:multiple sugar transport system permease protein
VVDRAIYVRRSRRRARTFFGIKQGITYIALTLGAILFTIPFLWMVSTSLKSPGDILLLPPKWIPNPVVWENYPEAWTSLPFTRFLVNTCTITFSCIIGNMLSCTLVAYGFSRLRFPSRGFWFAVLLSTMMLPRQVTMIPVFVLFRNLGWLNTLKPLIVPSYFGNAFYIFLLRQFFMTLPQELDDAATIDGCSTFGIYRQIILPLAKPALATVAVFSFISHWNDFLGPLIYLTSREKMTIAVGLRLFRGQYSTEMHLLMAASTVAVLPILVIYFVAQKYFIQGIALTGMKG